MSELPISQQIPCLQTCNPTLSDTTLTNWAVGWISQHLIPAEHPFRGLALGYIGWMRMGFPVSTTSTGEQMFEETDPLHTSVQISPCILKTKQAKSLEYSIILNHWLKNVFRTKMKLLAIKYPCEVAEQCLHYCYRWLTKVSSNFQRSFFD